jgi:hypothetical protein
MNLNQNNHSQVPRGKALFEPFKRPLRLMIQDFLLVIIFLASPICVEMSESIVSINSKLFLEFLIVAGFQIFAAFVFFKKVRHWKRWISMLCLVLTLIFTFLMLLRIFL